VCRVWSPIDPESQVRRLGGALQPERDGKVRSGIQEKIGLPDAFTFDACRHGGMTEREEAELTDGQGRALSGRRTRTAYAKRMLARASPATSQAPCPDMPALANVPGTAIQNEARNSIQTEGGKDDITIA